VPARHRWIVEAQCARDVTPDDGLAKWQLDAVTEVFDMHPLHVSSIVP
jgi:hypothetical protein